MLSEAFSGTEPATVAAPISAARASISSGLTCRSTTGSTEVLGACSVMASPRGISLSRASLWLMPVASRKSTTIRRSISTSDSPSKEATPM